MRAETAALAAMIAGALLANFAENRILEWRGDGVSAMSARLDGARLQLHRDGAARYRAAFGSMAFREDGAVALDSVDGEFAMDGRAVAFKSERGSVAAGGEELFLKGSVRIKLFAGEDRSGESGGASAIQADSAKLLLGEGGIFAEGNVGVDSGARRIDAQSLSWNPGEPLQLEEVRAKIP